MARKCSRSAVLFAVVALAGCGGDDSGSSSDDKDPKQAAKGGGSCVESWNGASPDVRAQASASHRGDGPDVVIGTYTGQGFKATGEFYDASGSSTSDEVAVAPGDCVAADLTGSNESETNWVMVAPKASGGGKAWYFLDETGDHPLAKPPQPLDGQQKAMLIGFGEEPKLQPSGG